MRVVVLYATTDSNHKWAIDNDESTELYRIALASLALAQVVRSTTLV